jgi:hypothetical protein
MKYLLLISRNPNAPMPSAEQFLAHGKWIKQKVQEGVMEVPYSFAVTGGGFCILNGTPEEVDALTDEAPLRAIADLELRPLVDVYAQMERIAAALKR